MSNNKNEIKMIDGVDSDIDFSKMLLIHAVRVSKITTRPAEYPPVLPQKISIETLEEVGERARLRTLRLSLNSWEAKINPLSKEIKGSEKMFKELNKNIRLCKNNDDMEELLRDKEKHIMSIMKEGNIIMKSDVEEYVG